MESTLQFLVSTLVMTAHPSVLPSYRSCASAIPKPYCGPYEASAGAGIAKAKGANPPASKRHSGGLRPPRSYMRMPSRVPVRPPFALPHASPAQAVRPLAPRLTRDVIKPSARSISVIMRAPNVPHAPRARRPAWHVRCASAAIAGLLGRLLHCTSLCNSSRAPRPCTYALRAVHRPAALRPSSHYIPSRGHKPRLYRSSPSSKQQRVSAPRNC